jgi:predicted phage baseplate assembly protein
MGWSNLLVTDLTQNFTRPGIVEFLAPADFAPRAEFGLTQYWLRFIWDSGRYLFDPRLHWVMLNTIMATESVTIRDEILGSSDGSISQSFYTTRKPVLRGPQLEVREPEVPSADEQQKIIEQEGEGAISVTSDAGGGLKQVWVRWTQAQDFYGSGPRDRHCVLNNLTGEITFGDGLSGMVPPAGSNNIRISYKTGGGSGGDKPAYTITQLKTTVPFVEKATNYAAASGGADGETTDSLLDRAPSVVRHRNRAVTIEDFEDLAKVASPDVARARCVPLFDLAANPDASGEEDQVAGTVSLIIVPRSTDPKPLPGIELIESVQEFIDERRIPVASLVVVGPDYVRVDVEADVAVTSMEKARDVEQAVVEELTRFLHPLEGGLDGTGWEFGREPHKSDLYALIEAIEGVDYVRSLKVTRTQDRTHSVIKTPETDYFGKDGRFLVYSGTHKITLSMEEG